MLYHSRTQYFNEQIGFDNNVSYVLCQRGVTIQEDESSHVGTWVTVAGWRMILLKDS